jgi:hypothetical protein
MGGLQIVHQPTGFCQPCGMPTYGGEEHDHRSIGTLTPEQATAYWQEKKEAEHASQSGQ